MYRSSRWGRMAVAALLAASAGLAGGLFSGRPWLPGLRHGRVETLTGPAWAIDGDSVRMRDMELRLQAIDAPELGQTCRLGGRETACGDESRRALVQLLRSGPVRCEVSGRDVYDRGLARCFVGDTEVNAVMVAQGHAIAYGGYTAEEAEARAARRGIWATRFERPADWRAEHPRSGGE